MTNVILLESSKGYQFVKRMNINVALGGGGAKGNAHIGVLRVLEKNGFKIQAVAGTSFGGIVAVFYALGYSPDKIETLFASLDQTQLYGYASDEAPSLLGLAGATRWLKDTLGRRTFDDLQIPCVLISADLKSGNEVMLNKGSLVDAVLATIAIPGIFPARRLGDFELVDGGALNPVPVSPLRVMAPHVPVVAVSLSTPLGVPAQPWYIPLPEYVPQTLINRLSQNRYSQALNVFLRSLDMVVRAVTEYRLQVDKPEVVIRPNVSEIDILERVNVHDVVKIGEEAAIASLPELKKLFAWHIRLRRAIGA